jgi:hypothetical protein
LSKPLIDFEGGAGVRTDGGDSVDDYVMATPAISHGSLLVRAQHYLVALGNAPSGARKP